LAKIKQESIERDPKPVITKSLTLNIIKSWRESNMLTKPTYHLEYCKGKNWKGNVCRNIIINFQQIWCDYSCQRQLKDSAQFSFQQLSFIKWKMKII